METVLTIQERLGLAGCLPGGESIKRPLGCGKKSLDVAPKAVNLRPFSGIKGV